jgi:UDP-N-acetylmuramoyl-tripeptide--D-alanyl-D-alanine ligase
MTIADLHARFLESIGVSTDTRKIQPGTIFFALKGANFNGNLFAHKALELGAKWVVADEMHDEPNGKIILVDDALKTMQELAAYHRQYLGIPIIAIAGSNGKTTTKELVVAVLQQKFKTGFTRGNFNNHIGVPLTVLSFTKELEIGVVEIGANHAGETAELCRIVKPDFGILTNNSKDHLEGFGSIEGVRKANAELYEYLREAGAKTFLNIDLPDLVEDAAGIASITYGSSPNAFCKGKIASTENSLAVEFEPNPFKVQTALFGTYNLPNVLAAVCVGRYFGVEDYKIKEALEAYRPGLNRSQIEKIGDITVIFDCYNANPGSMMAGILSFLEFGSGPKLMILGDMLELGEYAANEHKEIIAFLYRNSAIEVILVGPEFAKADTESRYQHYKNITDLKAEFNPSNYKNYTLFLKGSRGFKLEELFI